MTDTDIVLTDDFFLELDKKIDKMIFLNEAISGALIEITWILKAIFVMTLLFSVWRLVRK